jgi:hypothetical protein
MHLPVRLAVMGALTAFSETAFGHPSQFDAATAFPGDSYSADTGHTGGSDPERSFWGGWMILVEAAMQAPVDLGGRVLAETPFGLRAFGGYSWMPPAFLDVLTGLAAQASSDPRLDTLLAESEFTGRTWRVGLGVRPFRRLGLYLDAGYVQALLDASLSLQATDVPELAGLSGGDAMETRLDLAFVELGYQAAFGDRLVFAGGMGVLGTLKADSRLEPTDVAPDGELLSAAAAKVDSAFERYGFVPALSVRLGLDLL